MLLLNKRTQKLQDWINYIVVFRLLLLNKHTHKSKFRKLSREIRNKLTHAVKQDGHYISRCIPNPRLKAFVLLSSFCDLSDTKSDEKEKRGFDHFGLLVFLHPGFSKVENPFYNSLLRKNKRWSTSSSPQKKMRTNLNCKNIIANNTSCNFNKFSSTFPRLSQSLPKHCWKVRFITTIAPPEWPARNISHEKSNSKTGYCLVSCIDVGSSWNIDNS